MSTKKQQQNYRMLRSISDRNLDNDSSRYSQFKVDEKMAEEGSIAAMDPNFSLDMVSDDIKNDKDYPSYVIGFERTRRLLKIQNDLYLLGRDYFDKGTCLEEIPQNYRNNEYFMAGYNSVKIK